MFFRHRFFSVQNRTKAIRMELRTDEKGMELMELLWKDDHRMWVLSKRFKNVCPRIRQRRLPLFLLLWNLYYIYIYVNLYR